MVAGRTDRTSAGIESRLRASVFRASVFDERLQSRQRLIPLLGDGIKIFPDSFHRLRIELEMALAPSADAANNSDTLQHSEMLGNGLAGQTRAFGQLRNGRTLPRTELRNQRQSRFVAQRGKHGGTASASWGDPATVFVRHNCRCFSFARPSRRRSCAMLRRGDQPEPCRIQTR